ncbi:MAG TPA: hypothetical protein VNA57_11160 [Acidimicrobiales bacterium]|nr:hypothetical protein [Acidimicrobiales bacterium]
MTFPSAEEPGRPGAEDPDEAAGPAEAAAVAEPEAPLSEKPVLEWTTEDWARWVNEPAVVNRPEPKLAVEEPVKAAPAEPDPVRIEGDPTATWSLALDEDDGDAQWWSSVAGLPKTPAPEPAPPEPAPPEPAAARSVAPSAPARPAQAPPATVRTPTPAATPTPTPTPVPPAPAPEPKTATAARPAVSSPVPPPPLPAPPVMPRPPTSGPAPIPTPTATPPPVGPGTAAGLPTTGARRPGREVSPPRPRPSPQAEKEVRSTSRQAHRSSMEPADDLSVRVRAALSLLGVSVLVGAVTAGLITVAIFMASVVLRRALG